MMKSLKSDNLTLEKVVHFPVETLEQYFITKGVINWNLFGGYLIELRN
jgi:hypothetical protein